MAEAAGQPEALNAYFEKTTNVARNYVWVLKAAKDRDVPPIAAARILARKIVALRCRSKPEWFDAWLARYEGGQPPEGVRRQGLEIVIGSAVGLPERIRSIQHVEACIAEHLWYFMVQEETEEEAIRRLEEPSFEVTEPGGDGLVVHALDQGLLFRLWEIKKHTGRSRLSRTIGVAYTQLDKDAMRYLTKYSLRGQYLRDEELQRLYAQMPDLWLEGSEQAAPGVAVGTSVSAVTRRCFTSFPKRFPQFLVSRRLLGHVGAVIDFAAFALQVRDEMWKGL